MSNNRVIFRDEVSLEMQFKIFEINKVFRRYLAFVGKSGSAFIYYENEIVAFINEGDGTRNYKDLMKLRKDVEEDPVIWEDVVFGRYDYAVYETPNLFFCLIFSLDINPAAFPNSEVLSERRIYHPASKTPEPDFMSHRFSICPNCGKEISRCGCAWFYGTKKIGPPSRGNWKWHSNDRCWVPIR